MEDKGGVGPTCQEGSFGRSVHVGADRSARRLRGGTLALTHSHRHAVTHHLFQRVSGWIRPPSNTRMALVTHMHIAGSAGYTGDYSTLHDHDTLISHEYTFIHMCTIL